MSILHLPTLCLFIVLDLVLLELDSLLQLDVLHLEFVKLLLPLKRLKLHLSQLLG